MARQTAAQWSKLVEQWRRSKLSAREFAASGGHSLDARVVEVATGQRWRGAP